MADPVAGSNSPLNSQIKEIVSRNSVPINDTVPVGMASSKDFSSEPDDTFVLSTVAPFARSVISPIAPDSSRRKLALSDFQAPPAFPDADVAIVSDLKVDADDAAAFFEELALTPKAPTAWVPSITPSSYTPVRDVRPISTVESQPDVEYTGPSVLSLSRAVNTARAALQRVASGLADIESVALTAARSSSGVGALRSIAQRIRALKVTTGDADIHLAYAASGSHADVRRPEAVQRELDASLEKMARMHPVVEVEVPVAERAADLRRSTTPTHEGAVERQSSRYVTELDRLTAELQSMKQRMKSLNTETSAARTQLRDNIHAHEKEMQARKQKFDFEIEMLRRASAGQISSLKTNFSQRATELASSLQKLRGLIKTPSSPSSHNSSTELLGLGSRIEECISIAQNMARDPAAPVDVPVGSLSSVDSSSHLTSEKKEKERRSEQARIRTLEERCGQQARTLQSWEKELAAAKGAVEAGREALSYNQKLASEIDMLKKQLRDQRKQHDWDIINLKKGFDEERLLLTVRTQALIDQSRADRIASMRSQMSEAREARNEQRTPGARPRSAVPRSSSPSSLRADVGTPSMMRAHPTTPSLVKRPVSALQRSHPAVRSGSIATPTPVKATAAEVVAVVDDDNSLFEHSDFTPAPPPLLDTSMESKGSTTHEVRSKTPTNVGAPRPKTPTYMQPRSKTPTFSKPTTGSLTKMKSESHVAESSSKSAVFRSLSPKQQRRPVATLSGSPVPYTAASRPSFNSSTATATRSKSPNSLRRPTVPSVTQARSAPLPLEPVTPVSRPFVPLLRLDKLKLRVDSPEAKEHHPVVQEQVTVG